MAEIKLSPLVEYKLDQLIQTLFETKYFGFFDSCLEYVQNLRDSIFEIDKIKHKEASVKIYGNYFLNTNIITKRVGIYFLIRKMKIIL